MDQHSAKSVYGFMAVEKPCFLYNLDSLSVTPSMYRMTTSPLLYSSFLVDFCFIFGVCLLSFTLSMARFDFFSLFFFYSSAAVTGNKVEVNGVKIYYEKAGHGKQTVLLLPGAIGMMP